MSRAIWATASSREWVTESHANTARLVVIGAVAGAFSGLSGVGGGVIIVPLLMALLGYDARAATATSLAAIAIIAVWGVAAFGALGSVEWAYGLLVGIPALLGVTIGVRLRARISAQLIARVFAVILVVAAVLLVLIR
jgi:uncharacterized protein